MSTTPTSSVTRTALIRSYVVAVLALAASGLAVATTSVFISVRFPDRPVARDLLFEIVPRVAWMQYLADITLLAALALLALYAFRLRPREAPGVIALTALVQIARAAFGVLTPLANPLGIGTKWGFIPIAQNIMFPSGHVAMVFLFYLLVDGRDSPRLKSAMLALLVLECACVILARGHYSMDVIGGLMTAYVLRGAWESASRDSWLKRLVTP